MSAATHDTPEETAPCESGRPGRPAVSRRRRLLFGLAAMLATMVFLAIVGEVSLRVAGAAAGQNLLERRDNMFLSTEGHKYKPHTEFEVTDIEFRAPMRINNLGFRGPEVGPKRATYRVLCIGDSFTEAAGVAYADLMTTVAARHLTGMLGTEVEVINLGIAGWDPRNYLAVVEKYGRLLRPDVIWINFCCDNDFIKPAPRPDRSPVQPITAYDAGPALPAPSKDGFLDWLHNTLRQDSRLYAYLWLKLDAAVLWRFGLRALDNPVGLAPMDSARRSKLVQTAARWLGAIRDRAADLTSAPLVIVAMPTMYQFDDQLAARYRGAHHVAATDFNPDGPTDLLREALPDAGVLFLNPLDDYRRTTEPIYFHFYRHLNPTGSRFLGRFVAERIAALLQTRHRDEELNRAAPVRKR